MMPSYCSQAAWSAIDKNGHVSFSVNNYSVYGNQIYDGRWGGGSFV